MKAENQFEKFRARVEKKHAFDESLIAQFYLLDTWAKISFMEKVWPTRTTSQAHNELFQLMPYYSYSCVKDYIEANEPPGIFKNIEDISDGCSPYELRLFFFPINLIKKDYVQRAKWIDNYLDKKLKEPLAQQAYFSRPENLESYAQARGENDVVVERLIELKKRNQEDMQIIFKSRAGIQDDQDKDRATEKL